MKTKLFDKGLHFIVGFFGTLILTTFIPLLCSIIIMIIISIAKEVYDKYKTNPTGFSWLDLLADTIGVVLAIFIMLTS